jgi:hypothetical protein
MDVRMPMPALVFLMPVTSYALRIAQTILYQVPQKVKLRMSRGSHFYQMLDHNRTAYAER